MEKELKLRDVVYFCHRNWTEICEGIILNKSVNDCCNIGFKRKKSVLEFLNVKNLEEVEGSQLIKAFEKFGIILEVENSRLFHKKEDLKKYLIKQIEEDKFIF